MNKKHERILQLHSLLSKLLDSLCFELSVNKNDDNFYSLLEILHWKRIGEINEEQFTELYKSWLESKSIFDLFSCKQIETYPKAELICNELVQSSFMNVGQINKCLESINELYNKFYLEKRSNSKQALEQTQRIFSYLDSTGYIHLRLSEMFFLTSAALIAEKYTIPLNYEAFKVYFLDLRRELCEINGLASLRSFKNYMLGLNSSKRANLLEKILPVFAEIEKYTGGEKNSLPNIMDEAFAKWKNFPRFNSHDSRKNLQIYKRVFEENEKIFYDEGATINYFTEKYGEDFVKCLDIDSSLLREFNILVKQTLHKYIEIFVKVSQSFHAAEKNMMKTHRNKQQSDLHQPKMYQKQSLKQKTPTKSSKKVDLKSRTPTKAVRHEQRIHRQFGSAEKSPSKTYNVRQLTPTKSSRLPSNNLYQSQAYSNQKNAIKNGIESDSFYNKMYFFRNKRVQSYDIVMKRLKNK